MGDVDGLIFSKDRPAQLRLLLDSISAHAPDLYQSLAVIWTGSSPRYDVAYQECFAEGSPCLLMSKHEGIGTFRRDVLDWLDSAGDRVGFLVDDLVFYRDVPAYPCDSYRLGWNCTECYALTGRSFPDFDIDSHEPARVRWRTSTGDFGYPLSLDAHTYRKQDVQPIVEATNFTDPNTLEHGLYMRRSMFAPDTISCPPLSCAVGIPANIVNRTVKNRHGDNPSDAPLAMLERWEDGERLDLAAMDFSDVRGSHQEIPYQWKARVLA